MQARTRRNWIAVASAEHARLGRDFKPVGFMQVGHGKGAPLKRLAAGDRVAYYAPAEVFRFECALPKHRPRLPRHVSASAKFYRRWK